MCYFSQVNDDALWTRELRAATLEVFGDKTLQVYVGKRIACCFVSVKSEVTQYLIVIDPSSSVIYNQHYWSDRQLQNQSTFMSKNFNRGLISGSFDVIFDLSMQLSSYPARQMIIQLILSSHFKVITLSSPICRQLHNTIQQRYNIYYKHAHIRIIDQARFLIQYECRNGPVLCQWFLSNLLYNAFMKRRNLLRIRPKPQRARTEHIPASFTMTEPAVDDAKRYLAGLHEEQAGKESQLNHSLSLDFTLAEWKSRTQLHQTAPAKALLISKEMLLYDEEPEIIPVPPPEPILSPQAITPVSQEAPSPVKRRTHKLFFNFNKMQHSKTKTLSPASQETTPRKCIKPTLYTLSEQVNTPSKSKIKPIRLNLTPKIQDDNPLQLRITKTKSQLWPLHGIHQQRNKFQLLLNTRKQKAAKILQTSAIKPHIVINIFSRRLD